MPATFISRGYDTSDAAITKAAWADVHPAIGTASYGVRSPDDWKVEKVTGQARTVSVHAGRGFGWGIVDKTFEDETIQLAPIESGSRWDLIVARRNWIPNPGITQFAVVSGNGNPVIPAARQLGPGNIDDQPLALVRVTANQPEPAEIIDLRCWSGDGGGIVANHELVKSYLNQVGTHLTVGRASWVRRAGAAGPEWVDLGSRPGAPYTPIWTGVSDFGTGGSLTGTYWVDGDRVHVKARAVFGSPGTIGNNVVRCPLPPGYPLAPGYFHMGSGTYVPAAGQIRPLTVFADAGAASVWIASDPIKKPGEVPVSAAAGSFFDIDFTYQTSAV